MTSILKSAALIRSITRRAFIPNSQETFTDNDFLEMATEEVNLRLVPLIQRMHEEHLITFIEVPLVRGKTRYPIPARAHGNKLRDVALVDQNGNIFEMHRYSLSEISDLFSTTRYSNAQGFYLENNDVVITGIEIQESNFLRMYFYMRPNMLVIEDRGCVVKQATNLFEVDQITPKSGSITSISVAAESVVTSANHGLKNGDVILVSGTNAIPNINGNRTVEVISSNQFKLLNTSVTTAGSTGSWQLTRECKRFVVDKLPEHFPSESHFDFVLHYSPNKIICYDLKVNSIDSNTNEISFTASEVSNVEIGSYLTSAEETIVPNIPTELHPILAQRVAVSCLEAMGDEQNKQSATRTLEKMELDAGTFLDNRVEGASQKIKSRHSPLVNTLSTFGRRNRRW